MLYAVTFEDGRTAIVKAHSIYECLMTLKENKILSKIKLAENSIKIVNDKERY